MCKKSVLTIAAVAILALAIGQVQAVTVPIDNRGFEDPVVADGEYDYSLDNQGWGYFDNGGEQGSWNPGLPGTSEPGYGGNAPEGQNVGWANPGGVGVPGGFAQVLTDADATLRADMTYTLTVEVGNTLGYPWGGYKVQLLAGGIPHAPGTGGDYTGPVTGGTLLAEDDNSLTIAEDTFETSTVTYTYDPELHSGLLGEPLQIRLLSLGNVAAGDYTEADFDNVTLSRESRVPMPLAYGPEPGQGEMIEATAQLFRWKPGDLAVSHDVYFGDSLEDVNQATPESDTFQGNQAATEFSVQDLTPGATYYWRIDEVNDLDPNSPWKGKVWNFRVEPATAWAPSPANGGQYVLTDPTLTWDPGMGALFHTVYFGESLDEVKDATTGGFQIVDAMYEPDLLASGTTYHWRVDEFDATATTHKGDLWSFTTVPEVAVTDPTLVGWWTLDEGVGGTAVDWSGHGNHGTLMGDPQWVDGYHGGALEFDGSSDYVEIGYSPQLALNEFTVSAWVNIATEPGTFGVHGTRVGGDQTFDLKVRATDVHGDIGDGANWLDTSIDIESNHTGTTGQGGDLRVDTWYMITYVIDNTNQQVRLYLDGDLKRTIGVSGTPLLMKVGQSMRIGHTGTGSEWMNGLIDDVRVYSKALTEAEIAEAMRGNPLLAGSPNPGPGAVVDIRDATALSWVAGDTAVSHDVYFGTDRNAVAAADNSAAEFQGNQPGTSFSLAGLVELGGGDYFWRIDEVEADGTVQTGYLWRFNVPDFLTVDDFEDYSNEVGSRVFEKWIDGIGFTQPEPGNPGNGTGAAVGHDIWTVDSPYFEGTIMETGNVYAGGQAMPIYYAGGLSEAERTFTPGQNWTAEGVTTLVVHFRGETDNTGRLYVKINGIKVPYDGDPADIASRAWVAWEIDLASVGVSLTNVTTLTIGIEGGDTGVLYVDDILLAKP